MSALGRAWKKLRWSVRQRGVWGTVRQVVSRGGSMAGSEKPAVHPFDGEYGVETSGLLGGGQLGSGHAHDVHVSGYYGVQPSRLRAAVATWAGERDAGAYAFMDIGAGKGRAMMIASQLGFREVAGVELDPGLAAVGLHNLEVWQAAGRAGCAMRLDQGDVMDVVLPAGPVLFFLYNPFGAVVMRRFLERLVRERAEFDLMYMVPEQAAVLGEFAAVELVWSEVIAMSEEDAAADWVSTPVDRCNLYRLNAPTQS